MSDFPKVIEFQLHNMCNANCIICPYSEIKEKKGFMDELLFEKIINEVGDKKILLIPYLNNEPFLDFNYVDKLMKINKHCPNAQIEISTNLSKVNDEMISKLNEIHIYEMRISFFGYSKKCYEDLMPGLDYEKSWDNLKKLLESDLKKKIPKLSVTMIEHDMVEENDYLNMEELCKNNGIDFNRWGYLDRAGNNTKFSCKIHKENIIGCEQNRPLERMHILYDGTVILCCQDWRREVVMGDIKENTIREIWDGEKYQKIRSLIYGRNKDCVELCKHCKLAISN